MRVRIRVHCVQELEQWDPHTAFLRNKVQSVSALWGSALACSPLPPSVPHSADDLEASSLHHMKCYHSSSFTCLLLDEFQGLFGCLITAILCTDQNILSLSFLRATDQNLPRYPKEKEKERSHQVSRRGPPYENLTRTTCLPAQGDIRYHTNTLHSKYGPALMGWLSTYICWNRNTLGRSSLFHGPMLSSKPISLEGKSTQANKSTCIAACVQHQETAPWVLVPFLGTPLWVPYSTPVTPDLQNVSKRSRARGTNWTYFGNWWNWMGIYDFSPAF